MRGLGLGWLGSEFSSENPSGIGRGAGRGVEGKEIGGGGETTEMSEVSEMSTF